MGRKATVRERVLETASRLFYEQGYNNTGINQIIDEAGIAKASMYANFRTKEELCIAYLQRKDGAFRQALEDRIAATPAGRDQVLAIFDFLLDFYHTDDFRGCWCLNTLSELPSDNVHVKAEILNQKTVFRNIISRVVAENTDRSDPERLARMIYILYEGALTESYLHRDTWPIGDAREVVSGLLMN